MDPETNHDAIANVGIKDGKIAAITNNTIAGNETIEATGLIVVPGFIDHQQAIPWTVSRSDFSTRRVTTAMDLEAGALNVDQWHAAKKG
jgi:N-acyl-D-amino-acid deacylase